MKTSPVLYLLLAAASLCFTAYSPAAPPFINEFLAINHGPALDDLGRTSDWIEIKNPGPGAVDLAGWTLTDEPDIAGKWVFPATTLNAGEFLIVRASGMDRRDPAFPLHTNFTLSGSGEFLGLYSPAAVPASVWQPYPRQFSGVSFGTIFSGASQGYFLEPTPREDNHLEALTDYVRDTHFDAERGFFTTAFPVTITTATPGAEIRYTIDGSEPSELSPLYTVPVTVSTTTALRARAFKLGMVPSNIDTQTYIFAASWKTQPDFPAGFPQSWGQFDSTLKVLADYGMNPSVTNNATYRPLIIPAMTQTLPVVCLTGSMEDIFGDDGIHGNLRSTDAEVPVAIEYFHPLAPADHFVTRGALQAHGGAVRNFAKKAFRIDFTGTFGDGPLQHPLFAGSAVETFDQLVLRPGGHDSFTVQTRGGNPDQNDHAFHASYLRDQFLRRTENENGLLSPRGRYVHLCINGLYWGLYDLHERPNAAYASEHQGGPEAAWDVLHHNNVSSSQPPQVIDGTDAEWNALQALCVTPVLSNADYLQLAALLGPDRFIDHLLIRMWAGDHDWLGPAYMPSSTLGITADAAVYSGKNWYALRDSRKTQPGPWQFFTWDAEISMGNHLLFRLFDSLPTPAGLDFPHFRELNMDVTGISRANTPAAPWAALSAHPEFRLNVADRAHRLLHHDGALSPAAASARMAALIQELDLPLVAESARWGGVSGFTVRSIGGIFHRLWDNGILTRDTHWRPEVAWLRDTFCTQRGGILLNQLKARNLYPATEPVEITPPGGSISEVFVITLSAPAGTIYYTVDGSDPRTPLSGVVTPEARLYDWPFPAPETPDSYTIKARAFNGLEWSALTEAHFTSTAVPPAPGTLAFTEIHYHPAEPTAEEIAAGFTDADDFEFLEILSVSYVPVQLQSLRFAAGVDFDFARDSSVRELAPSGPAAIVVLASNTAAFQFRYGFAPAGVFANGTRLSNSGERLKLVRADGLVIAEFDYNDRGDWPAAADGGGYSLNLLSPGTSDPDPGENWHVSAPTPGTSTYDVVFDISLAAWSRDYFTSEEITVGLITGPLADPDTDGLANVIEFLTKSNPRQPSSPPITVSFPLPGKVRFIWERRAGSVTGYRVEFQTSSDGTNWTSPPGNQSAPDSRAKVQVTHDFDMPGMTKRFARLRAVPLP